MSLKNSIFTLFFLLCSAIFSVNSSTWVPIATGDITSFIPVPSVKILSSSISSTGNATNIPVGNVGATKAYYYRANDLLTGNKGAWQCATADSVSKNNNIIKDLTHRSSGNYQYEISACMTGEKCDVNAFTSNALICSSLTATKTVQINYNQLSPAPALVSSPAIATGPFSVYWSMSSDDSVMLMSAGSTQGVVKKSFGPVCPGGCNVSYDYVLEQSKNGGAYTVIYQGSAKSKYVSVPVGTYRFRVKAKEQDNPFVNFSAYKYSNVTTVQNEPPPPPPGNGSGELPNENITLDTAVIEGGASVSGGQASYQIPVQIPVGRNGVQPNISLNYSSSGGNGVVGVGWGLNATSAISRCAATYAQDGFTKSVTYDSTKDRLCLNGQRLMAVSGSYGSTSTIYKTEIDSFVRVKQFGNINDSYTRFEATYANGTVAYFGNDAQSRNQHPGAAGIMSWNISMQHDDTEKNYIHFDYDDFGAGEQLISNIYYTGNGASSSYKGNRRVNFAYNSRADSSMRYIAGGKKEQTKILSTITTYVANTKIRKYNLAMKQSAASNRSLLESVTLCGYTNNSPDCAPPTTFSWSDKTAKIKLQPLGTNGRHAYPNITSIDSVVPRGDRNGDGVRDWSGLYVNAEGEFTSSNTLDLEPCTTNIFSRSLECSEGDFNQDGITDDWDIAGNTLVLNITNGSSINTGIQLLNSGKYGIKSSRIVNISDYNGDSWPDLMVFHDNTGNQNRPELKLYLHSQNVFSPYSTSSTVFEYPTLYQNGQYSLQYDIQFVGDMTGDGLPDLVSVETGAGQRVPYAQPKPVKLFKSRQSGGFSQSHLNFGISNDPLVPKFTYFMDINGDGLSDWLGWDRRQVLIARLNKGDGVFDSEITLQGDARSIVGKLAYISHADGEPDRRPVPKYEAAFKFHDIDGDGKSELLMPGTRVLEGCALLSTSYPTSSRSYRCGDALYGETYSRKDVKSKQSINSALSDYSIYQFDALSFKTLSDGSISVTKKTTNLYGHAYQSIIVDAFGNGMPTLVFNHKIQPGIKFNGNASGTPFSGYESSYGVYINRSFGAGNGATNKNYIPTDMLEKSTNGLGLESKWAYRPLSSGVPSALQDTMYTVDHRYAGDGYFHFASSMYVVQNFKQSNGIGGHNETQYAYKGAMYNPQGRGFMGFRSIVQYNPVKSVVSHTDFHQKFPYQGKVQYQATFKESNYPSNISTLDDYHSNRYVSHTENSWQINTAHQTANGTSLERCEYDDEMKKDFCVTTKGTNAVQHVYLSTAQSTSRDINNASIIQSTQLSQTNINQCGNVGTTTKTQTDAWGTYKQISTKDTRNASCDNSGVWWPHKTSNQTVTKKAVVRNNSYDALSLYNGSEFGLDQDVALTTTYQYGHAKIRKPTKTTITTPSDNSIAPSVTNVIYNHYGLPSEVNVVAKVKGNNTTRKVSRTKYSKDGINEATSGDGYFPWETKNALNHITKIQTNTALGKPSQVSQQLSGSHYFTTRFTFDALGRPLSTSAPNSPTVHLRYSLANPYNHSMTPALSVTTVTSRQQGSPTQRVYKDLLGRDIRTAVEGFSDEWTITDKQYDALGNVIFESIPQSENGTTYGVNYAGFDILGRPATKVTQQVCGALAVSYLYSGLNTDISANDQCSGGQSITMARTYNSLKQLMNTVDANGGTTRYAYNAAGLPIVIRDASNTDAGTIIAKYNALGRKIKVNDPNQGISTFAYTGFGELEKTVQNADKSSKVTLNNTLDLLGRVTVRTATGENTLRYTYDTGNYALGKLSQETGNGVTRRYTYTAYGQLKDTLVSMDNRSYKIQNTYDNTYGRPLGLIYPNNLHIGYEYNSKGYVTQVKNAASNLVYQHITAQNHFGQITASVLGNGVSHTANYSDKTGQVLSLGYTKNNDNVLGITYGSNANATDGYDGFGNMVKSVTVRGSIINSITATETYAYDSLQRLVSNSIQGVQSVAYTYDAVGNLQSKSDYANTYHYASHLSGYSGGGSNAVKRVRKNNTWYGFSYDNRGNLIKGDGLVSATYNAMDKPTYLNKNNSVSQFYYGPNAMRYKQRKTVAGKSTITYYVEGLYEEEVTGIKTQSRAYIGDIAIVSNKSSGAPATRYTHKDRLGSTLAFTNEVGQVVAQRLFDPFGKPRNIDGRMLSVPRFTDIAQSTTNRGFTDHEHLNEAELIHMNGRVYDYNLGRFLSVDPFVHEGSQGINPYSYIMNNPLAGTDPTGYAINFIGKEIEPTRPPKAPLCIPGGGCVSGSNVLFTNSSSSNGSTKNTESNTDGETSNTTDLLGQSSTNDFSNKDTEINMEQGGGSLKEGGSTQNLDNSVLSGLDTANKGVTGAGVIAGGLEATKDVNLAMKSGAGTAFAATGNGSNAFTLTKNAKAKSILTSLDLSSTGKDIARKSTGIGILVSIGINSIDAKNGRISVSEAVGKSSLDVGVMMVAIRTGLPGAIGATVYAVVDMTYDGGMIQMKRDVYRNTSNPFGISQSMQGIRRREDRPRPMRRMKQLFGIPDMGY